jgi:hypothetical protein
MRVTRELVAEWISAYLRGEQSLADLVWWAEDAMREGEFADPEFPAIRDVITRLGLAEVAAFGLTWADASGMLSRLDYRATVEIQAFRSRSPTGFRYPHLAMLSRLTTHAPRRGD